VGRPGPGETDTVIPGVFEVPHFTFWTVFYTAVGSAIFWARTGRAKLRVYFLSFLFDMMKVPDNPFRQIAEFVIFIIFGCVIGIGLAKPSTVAQALTAGFAWTGFVAKRG
jgi:hypothetical protein